MKTQLRRVPGSAYTAERGFTLVEVLVALIIIAVGMLGLAKIQALAYASSGNSNLRSLAALEASSLISAMRADRNYWSIIGTPLLITLSGSTITVTTGDAGLAAPPANQCLNAACTTVQLAANDLHNWAVNLNALLPGVTGQINCPVPVTPPIGCWIQLNWTERTTAVNAQSLTSNSNALATPVYTLYVVP